ncbi:MAG TPA: hypothetical protein VNE82_10670 [Candidatus Binataceae bacterium]|nr:hypothetical protein [Candidatus Binataceae bacterium]
MALREGFAPLENACAALGRIALLRFESADAEREFAEQLRNLARQLRERNHAEGAAARSILNGVVKMEQKAALLAASKTDGEKRLKQ